MSDRDENGATIPTLERGFLAPVESRRVSDIIAERIAGAIRDGELKIGERLPTEHQLARQLGVGRTSIREALQKLRALGLVEVRKGFGAQVATPRFDDPLAEFVRWTTTQGVAIEKLIEARIALETLAAALAAVHASDDEIGALEEHNRVHVEAGDKGDLAALVRGDEAFHESLMAAGQNDFVRRMYSVLIAELTDFRRRTLALPWAPARSATGHRAIIDAVALHDPAAARAAMLDHLYVLYAEVAEIMVGEGRQPEGFQLVPREALA